MVTWSERGALFQKAAIVKPRGPTRGPGKETRTQSLEAAALTVLLMFRVCLDSRK